MDACLGIFKTKQLLSEYGRGKIASECNNLVLQVWKMWIASLYLVSYKMLDWSVKMKLVGTPVSLLSAIQQNFYLQNTHTCPVKYFIIYSVKSCCSSKSADFVLPIKAVYPLSTVSSVTSYKLRCIKA